MYHPSGCPVSEWAGKRDGGSEAPVVTSRLTGHVICLGSHGQQVLHLSSIPEGVFMLVILVW